MSARELSSFYQDGKRLNEYLLQIAEQAQDKTCALPVAQVPELSTNTLKTWQEIRRHCLVGFAVREPAVWLEALQNLEAYGRSLAVPEGRILAILARQWHDKIRDQHWEPAEVAFEIAPELSIKVGTDDTTEFVVVAKNHGRGPAVNIRVRLTSEGKLLEENRLGSLPGGGVAAVGTFSVASSSSQWQLIAEYKDFLQPLEFKQVPIPIARQIELPKDQMHFLNPYVADRPLYPDEPYVGRENILMDIERSIQDERGGIINVWGLRRVGKTSLLYRLIDDARTGKVGCVPVYINCIIFERESSWSCGEFLGVVARATRSRICKQEGFRDNVSDIPEGPLSIEGFVSFIAEALGVLRPMKLALIFDDADVFGEENLSDVRGLLFGREGFDKAHRTFRELCYPPDAGSQGTFVLFATGTALGNLWLDADVSVRMNKRLCLLTEDEVKKLVELDGRMPLKYEYLALKYLWRVTGGYPALVQLVCSAVIREWSQAKTNLAIIPLTFVRRVVLKLITNADLQGYFKYLYCYGIPEKARTAFRKMALASNVVDCKTMQVNDREFDPDDLLNLTTNEILEERGNKRFLRVGLLKFFVENYLSGEDL